MPSTEPTRNEKPNVADLARWIKLWISLSTASRSAIANRRTGQLYSTHRATRSRRDAAAQRPSAKQLFRYATLYACYIAASCMLYTIFLQGLPPHPLAVPTAIGVTAIIATLTLSLSEFGVRTIRRRHRQSINN